jgi:hypothetical protein
MPSEAREGSADFGVLNDVFRDYRPDDQAR